MIPKVIHYCWFGGKPIPKEYMKYIDSWKRFLPDYEIKRWDESNFDIHCNKFVEAAYNGGVLPVKRTMKNNNFFSVSLLTGWRYFYAAFNVSS